MKQTIKTLIIFVYLLYGFPLFSQEEARVGIGTSNPEATLHVEGNMAIRELEEVNTKTTVIEEKQLFWSPETGEIKLPEENKFPFFVVDFIVQSNGSDGGDHIKKFDTKIDATKFEAMLVSAYPELVGKGHPLIQHVGRNYRFWTYENSKDKDGLSLERLLFPGETYTIPDSKYVPGLLNPLIDISFKEDENTHTWTVKLDYIGANSANGAFKWNLKFLVIDKSYARRLEGQDNFVGDGNGSGPPSGAFDKNPLD